MKLRWPDSRESIRRFASGSADSRESFQGSRTEPLFFWRIALRGAKIANRRFEAIRANRSHIMKIGFFSANRFARIANRGFSANRFARIAPIRVANRRAI